MSDRLPLAARRARIALMVFFALGVIQASLLGDGIGSDPGIRYGLGIPLTIAFVVSATAYFQLRRPTRG